MAASDLCDLLESIEVAESFEWSGVFLENLLHILNNNGNEQCLNNTGQNCLKKLSRKMFTTGCIFNKVTTQFQ